MPVEIGSASGSKKISCASMPNSVACRYARRAIFNLSTAVRAMPSSSAIAIPFAVATLEELAHDPRFASWLLRNDNAAALMPLLEIVRAPKADEAVLATAFSFSAWQTGVSRIGANRVLVYQYLITVVGVASGIIFFGETLGIEKIVGGAVILIGVYLARRQ